MTVDEWDAIYLYCAFAFQKVGGEPFEGLDVKEIDPISAPLEEDEIIIMSSE